MFISLNWIKDWVDLSGLDEDKLIHKFTLSCAEVEGIEHKGENISGIITARIEKVEEHPKSKKLHLLKVNNGKELIDVVCGAPNVREGMIIPFAQIGAKIGEIVIGKAELAGCVSNGMCCSAKELGISDDHSGLFEFEENTKLGVDVKELLDIDDVIFEVDNKSLTNRPDLWGHYGIAREFAALTGRPLKALDVAEVKNDLPKVDVQVKSESCYRYSSIKMENITRKVSPTNMQIRLFYCGMRGINFLTDITNYIMLELGQPMHAFDNDIVNNICVENVEKETSFKTLDSTERMLPAGTMVIKNNNEAVAIAGVMGGLNSAISDNTKNVLVESACFDGVQVRRTAIKLGLRTEASARYEKMLDTNLTMVALLRYVQLVNKLDESARVSSGITDVVKFEYPKIEIEISKAYIDRYIGQEIEEEKIINILESLQFKVENKGNGQYKVCVPSHRATKDINGKADLVEEVTRIYGYDNIVAKSTLQNVEPVKENKEIALEYAVKYALASRYNMSEVHSYIWYDSEFNKMIGIKPSSVIKIVNSIQKDNDEIRSTMVPTILKTIYDNKNDFDSFGIFEIGRIVDELKDGLTNEKKSLCVALVDKNKSEQDLLIELKNVLDYLFDYEIKASISFEIAETSQNWFSPVNYYNVLASGVVIGKIGCVHPKVLKKIDNKINIAVAEINFSEVLKLSERKYLVESVSKYPGSEQDFNFIVPKNMSYAEVEKIANSIKLDLNYKVSLLDIYEPENSDIKNMTLHYDIYRNDRTLTGKEVEDFHNSVIDHFKANNIELKLN